MKIDEVVEVLRSILEDRFATEGFEFRKSRKEYYVKAGEFRPIFRLGINAKTDWFLITPGVGVSCPEINREYNRLIPDRNQISSTEPTLYFGVGNETKNERGRYQVETEDEAIQAAESIWQDYQDIAKPFFEKMRSINAIDDYLNRDGVGQTTWTALTGLAAAYLGQNPSLPTLCQRYAKILSNYPDGNLIDRFIEEYGYTSEVVQQNNSGSPD